MGHIQPRTLAAGFGLYFGAIFLLAWNYARNQPSPWYGPDLSRWVYATYLVAAAALVSGISAAAVARVSHFDRRIAELEAGPPAVGSVRKRKRITEDATPVGPVKDAVDRDIDDLLGSLSELEGRAVEEAGDGVLTVVESGEPSEVSGPEEPSPVSESEEASSASTSALAASRVRLLHRRKAVSRYVMGPAAVGVMFLGISGALLPGVDEFLQTFHQANTALVLGMAYSWIGLGAYAAASLYAMLKDE